MYVVIAAPSCWFLQYDQVIPFFLASGLTLQNAVNDISDHSDIGENVWP